MFRCMEAETPEFIINLDAQARGPRRLVVTIVNARHLPRKDFFGKIDPYCVLEFFGFEYQTQTIKNNYNPDWNDSYFFDIDDVGQQPGKLRVSLFDWDRVKSNDYVGDIEISGMRMWNVLRAPIGWEEDRGWQVMNAGKPVIGNDKQPSIVSIRLQVLELMQVEYPIDIDPLAKGARSMEVTVVSARHLPKKDLLGSIDPFCVVEFAGLEFETTTLINNYSPDWDESFMFEVADCMLTPGPLRITVMDWDRLSANDKVGEVVISADRMWDVIRAQMDWAEERDFPVTTAGGQPVIGFDKHTSIVTLRLRVLEVDKGSRESLCCASGPQVRHESVQMFSLADGGGSLRPGGYVTKYQEQSKAARGRITTNLSVQGIARSIVSGKKRRFTEGGHDLDLTYITPRVIAMGYPSGGLLESNYRNSMADVYRFFQQRHAAHYLIVNLCAEREYDFDTFHGACVRYPFPDHYPPALELIIPCCAFMHRFLQRDEHNVVAVHCKAGKGRTGLMVVCYLLFSGLKSTARSARCLYDWTRTKDGKGLTITSQIRYAHYFEALLRLLQAGDALPELQEDRAPAVGVVRVRIHTIPRFDVCGCDPVFTVSVRAGADHKEHVIFYSDPAAVGGARGGGGGGAGVGSFGSAAGGAGGGGGGGVGYWCERWLSEQTDELGRSLSNRPGCGVMPASRALARRDIGRTSRWDLFPEAGAAGVAGATAGAVRVAGDFHVVFYNRRRGCATVDVKRMFHFWLHSGMLARPPAEMGGRARALPDAECEAEGLPRGTWSLTLSKHEVDKAAKDRRCTHFEAEFCVEVFWLPLPGEIGAGPALDAARAATPAASRMSSTFSQFSSAGSGSSVGDTAGAMPLAAEREGYSRAVQRLAGMGLPAPGFEQWLLGRYDDGDGTLPAPPSPSPSPPAPPAPVLPLRGDSLRSDAGGAGGVAVGEDYEESHEADPEDDDEEYDESPDVSRSSSLRSAESMRSLSVRSGSMRPGAAPPLVMSVRSGSMVAGGGAAAGVRAQLDAAAGVGGARSVSMR